MSSPFIGEIKIFAGNFAPSQWAICNGALQSIAQNDALFALLGTTYGGDGVNTFGLPDLRGRIPVGQGQGPGLANYVIGQLAGTESVSLLASQLPAHTHPAACSSAAGTSATPGGNFWAANANTSTAQYSATANNNMNPGAIGQTGNNIPHPNVMPFLAINYIISLFGIFPSRN